ncbi:MAG: dTMP kinase [Bdellovibrionales bacterium]|nr:dTMP kinase [Bdellovibrionales bacterium]
MAFLVFEGLDGAGKSTLIRGLEDHLSGRGIKTLLTREPGGTPLGEEIRSMLLRTQGDSPVPRAELLLYQAARAQHVEMLLKPAIDEGTWVLCDRFTQSTVAFQVGGRKLEATSVDWLNQYATGGLAPDLVILLDLSVDESLNRMAHRENQLSQARDRFELEQKSFHEGVRGNYLAQAKLAPDKWLVLSAEKSPEALLTLLISALEKKGWLDYLTF